MSNDTAPVTVDTTTARDAACAATWVKYPERLVTLSTGTVHVSTRPGFTLCATRSAGRAAAVGVAVTCRMCGAA